MARDPDDRYPSAAAMKADLDDPSAVIVTGRAERLTAPTPWKSRWRKLRIMLLIGMVPILLFFLFFLLLSRRHG
jgi:hypothetical protein